MRFLIAISMLLATACFGAEPVLIKQGPADADGSLQVYNVAGTVTVTGWDKKEFAVYARTEEGVEKVDVTTTKGQTMVRVVLRKGVHSNGAAHLQVNVPVGSRAEVVATSASISLDGVTGALRLQSVSGAVTAKGFGGSLDVRAISGRVEVTGGSVASRMRLEAVSGAVRVRQGRGDVDATSTSGEVDVVMAQAERIRIRAHSGRAQVDAQLSKGADVDVESTGGAVQARLVAAAGYRYDASSLGGAFRACFGSGERTGQVGAGGGTVRLRSLGGGITLCDR